MSRNHKQNPNNIQKPKLDGIIDNFHYLSIVQAAVINSSSSIGIFSAPDADPKDINIDNKQYKYVPWGSTNDTPNQIISKVYKHPTTSGGIGFNISIAYGDGILPVRRIVDGGQLKLIPVLDNAEINQFLEYNNSNDYLLEQATDLRFFFNVFSEIILNRDNASSRKIVEINHKEAAFSRWSERNDKGIVEYHFYNPNFGNVSKFKEEDTEITPVLDFKRPILDLKRRLGREPGLDGQTKESSNFYRFIVPITFPTPGRTYYQKPYWWSIFESGWYDYACMIPEYKAALMKNQMVIKYVVYIAPEYWTELFANKGCANDKKKMKEARDLEYENIQNFLSGKENTGKAVISNLRYAADGKENPHIKIVPVDNPFKGGEFVEDSEEVSNLMSYGMEVHQGIIGSSPDKNKTISGSEARELFNIKQAVIKPIRDKLLLPLYIAKAINNWPADIFFAIPNVQLTTLDKNTGAEKVISQPALS
jgi:hypothetical protein